MPRLTRKNDPDSVRARQEALGLPEAGLVEELGGVVRILPLVMADARRRQRRYKRKIESGRWP